MKVLVGISCFWRKGHSLTARQVDVQNPKDRDGVERGGFSVVANTLEKRYALGARCERTIAGDELMVDENDEGDVLDQRQAVACCASIIIGVPKSKLTLFLSSLTFLK